MRKGKEKGERGKRKDKGKGTRDRDIERRRERRKRKGGNRIFLWETINSCGLSHL